MRYHHPLSSSSSSSAAPSSKLCRDGEVACFAKRVLSARLWSEPDEDLALVSMLTTSSTSSSMSAASGTLWDHPVPAMPCCSHASIKARRHAWIMGLLVAATALATVYWLSRNVASTQFSLLADAVGGGGAGARDRIDHSLVLWTCPSSSSSTEREKDAKDGSSNTDAGRNHEASFDEYLAPVRDQRAHLKSFLDNYRNATYDAWGLTYEQVLEGMRPWKERHVIPNVKAGDALYESACGIGLNLVMTGELLHRHGIDQVRLFGNEVLPESADLANLLLPELVPQFGGAETRVCAGDSTNLSHVPDGSMDLVWCGYMSELYDPLGFYDNLTYIDEDEALRRHDRLCRAPDGDWRSRALLKVAMERLDSWHRAWVGEMIRIAKPGKAVIVEQVRDGRCRGYLSSFAGISKAWWPSAIERFGWDVEPDSLRFEADVLFRNRYHVFMRKNNR